MRSLTPEEIEQTTRYRKLFEVGVTKAERDAVLEQGSAEMGIRPRSLVARWHRLGMCREWNVIRPVVLRAVKAYPYTSDRKLALLYGVNFSSFASARQALLIPSCLHRRRSALRAEVAVYVRDYPDLSAAQVRSSIRADGELPWRFSVRAIAQLMQEVEEDERATP
tara:strand:- start:466 stop:963 length:498 start_codon:yes stop_codon:yes gene_type:complete